MEVAEKLEQFKCLDDNLAGWIDWERQSGKQDVQIYREIVQAYLKVEADRLLGKKGGKTPTSILSGAAKQLIMNGKPESAS
jgi:hypothetical protein